MKLKKKSETEIEKEAANLVEVVKTSLAQKDAEIAQKDAEIAQKDAEKNAEIQELIEMVKEKMEEMGENYEEQLAQIQSRDKGCTIS